MPERDAADGSALQPYWSGVIAFSLVRVPVSLYAAHRRSRPALRLVHDDGTPLSRRYVCPEEGKPLTSDEIVRGYEVEEGSWVIVRDEELDALEPAKSREIDLRRFVPRDALDPVFFERPYVLVPEPGAAKAYLLLARAMEEERRAGVATFVMRGKEYLVAIFADDGVLHAETLRFAAELRAPADLDLPEPALADVHRVAELERAIDGLSADGLDRSLLRDPHAARLSELIEEKLDAGVDVVEARRPEPDEPEVDLAAILRGRLSATAARDGHDTNGQDRDAYAAADAGGRTGRTTTKRAAVTGALMARTKAELYEQAKALDIAGRSAMSKEELARAIRERR